MISEQRKTQHLFLRAGFGLSPRLLKTYKSKSISEHIQFLFKDAEKPDLLNIVKTTPINFPGLEKMSKDERQVMKKQMRDDIKNLNAAWIDRMISGKGELREKMTLFWHGHFACKSPIAYFTEQQNNTIRKQALGKFGDLLLAVSKDPAMLQFLNNQQNRKQSPNENFAREVLELFTLGRGNYTEQDIKNAAKAFTGWGFNKTGEFMFRQNQHDFDEKTFMGKTGNFNGEDIIQIILKNPQTAKFIVAKVYKYFVNDVPDKTIINQLADEFYKSDYDIAKLMQSIFSADWFYQEKHIANHIKSPVELLVSIRRTFGISFTEPHANMFIQKVLGQMLFNPPNVSGWAGGRTWIDSSTLLFRLQITNFIFLQSDVEIDAKDDGDVDNMVGKRGFKNLQAQVDLKHYLAAFKGEKDKLRLYNQLSEYLLQQSPKINGQDLIKNWSNDSEEEFIKKITMTLTAMPEYQMS